MRELDVWVSGKKVGTFRTERSVDATETYILSYGDDARPEDLVSLTMVPQVQRRQFSVKKFPPSFDMILPEGGRRVRIQEHRKILAADDFSLLEYVGGNPINRVVFLPTGEAPSTNVPQLPTPIEIRNCEDGQNLFKTLLADLDLRQGIAGVQPKILGHAGEQKMSPDERNHRGSTHILKGSEAKYPFLAANEKLCLDIFRSAGLETANSQLSADGQILLVERFDRNAEGAFIGFEELGALMGETSETKFNRDYGSMINTACEYVEPIRVGETRNQLFESILLSYMLGNGDAHLKNFGVIYNNDLDVKLSPVYDIVCTKAYIHDDIPALCLSYEYFSKDWWPRQRLMEFGRQYGGMTTSELRHTEEKLVAAVMTGVQHAQEMGKAIHGFKDIADRLAAIWTEGANKFRPPRTMSSTKNDPAPR